MKRNRAVRNHRQPHQHRYRQRRLRHHRQPRQCRLKIA